MYKFFQSFVQPEQEHPYAFANREMDSVYEWVRRNPTKMMIVKTPSQLQHAIKEKVSSYDGGGRRTYD